VLIAVLGLWVNAITGPTVTFACTCAPTTPDAIGKFGDDPAIVVFVGTITRVGPDRDTSGHTTGTLEIQKVFKGDLPAEVTVIGGQGGDCTISIGAGRDVITAARYEDGAVTPGACMPLADPSTAEGKRLLAEATRAYGPARVLTPAPSTANEPLAPAATPSSDQAAPILVGVVIVVLVAAFWALMRMAQWRSAS